MRSNISIKTVKKLFALSGNKCSFPDCDNSIFDENGTLIGEICHIEAANPSGERYNPDQTDKERNSDENLILLCPIHHKVTNDVSIYTVERLKAMKESHEELHKKNKFAMDQGELSQIFSLINLKLSEVAENTKKLSQQERYQLKLKFSTLVPRSLTEKPSPLCLGLDGMNIGERAITLSSWGFSFPNEMYVTQFPLCVPVNTPNGVVRMPEQSVKFPYELKPGKSVLVWYECKRASKSSETRGLFRSDYTVRLF